MKTTIKKLSKNEYVQTIVAVTLIVALVAGLIAAVTAGYVRVVDSGSMCIPYGYGGCNGWTDIFDRTLHVGDVLLVVPMNVNDLNANYPNSDIIVYHSQYYGDIVHRIAAETTINGTRYFYTKGDGNFINKWPNSITPSEYDAWNPSPVPPDQIVGKVVMRIPWVGHIALFMQNILTGVSRNVVISIIAILVALIIIVEFVLPFTKTQAATQGAKLTRKPAESWIQIH